MILATLKNLPFVRYAQWIGIIGLAGFAAWVAWQLRSATAEQEKQMAVNIAVTNVQNKLDNERWLRAEYARVTDDRLQQLVKLVANIQAQRQVMTRAVATERATNPDFYKQSLPAKGYEQWKNARALAATSPASSSAP